MSSSSNIQDLVTKSIKGGKNVKKLSLSELTNFFKSNRVDLNVPDTHGYNLLHYAIKSENADVVNLLLSLDEENFATEKANPNICTNDVQKKVYLSPILYTLQNVNDTTLSTKIIKTLIKYGGDINFKDEEGCILYLRAAEKGRIDLIEFLINYSAEKENSINFTINEVNKNGSALHMAIIGDQEDAISFLLENKIDVTLTDSNKNTALHLALTLKMNNVFKLIQDFVIKSLDFSKEFKKNLFNAQNDEGNSILHELAYAKCHFMIQTILKFPPENSVDPEIRNKDGYTYKGVQDNIVKLEKEKEEKEKLIKEHIRKEKERLAEEKRQEILREKEEMKNYKLAEEKREQLGLTFLKYRGIIFFVLFALFMVILFVVIKKATIQSKKIEEI
jgi:ankyrin repeat protein